ncbi:MAG TPA: DUF4229 domain-containing protein [Streptosporangiaceae bacterium]|jgi:hypothetical protein|nr:DUF4229 domain-containing protein [Streptosporangiaceae bacterium]
MRIFAYTASRVTLFLVVLLLLDLAGARGLLLIALALLISGLLSYVLLSRQRDAMAGSLSQRLSGVRGRATDFRDRLNEGTRAEDTDDEATASPVSPGSSSSAPAEGQPGATSLKIKFSVPGRPASHR